MIETLSHTGIRTHAMEFELSMVTISNCTHGGSNSIRTNIHVPIWNGKDWRKITKNLLVRNFLKNLKIVVLLVLFAKDVLKFLLRGPKTIRKKYEVVVEKFANVKISFSKIDKKLPKLFCSIFFEKFRHCYFTYFFAEDVLKCLLRGPKIIRKNIKFCSRNLQMLRYPFSKKLNLLFKGKI